jgi:uncharacterized protein
LKVIITGGTGFIGRALAAELAGRGDDVLVLTRNLSHTSRLPPGVQAVVWDVETGGAWGSQINQDTAIVNLAGAGIADRRWTNERKRVLRESRLAAGRAVTAAVRSAPKPPRVVVQASAVGFYGATGDSLVTESTGSGADFLARLCVEWEASTIDVEAVGVRRAIIRTGLVLGKGGGALRLLALPFRFFVGGRLGSGQQWVSWIHLADEVAAIIYVIDHGLASGAFNLTSPYPVRNATFAQELGHALGRPALFPAPALALRLLLGDTASVLLEGQRVLPTRLLDLGFAFRFSDLGRALADAATG